MQSRALVLFVLLAAAMSPNTTAHAQSHSTSPPGYSEAVLQGLRELEAGNFPEAKEEFRRAHAIFPNARTLRGLGMVEFELRNYGESARRIEEALESSVKPLEGKLRSDAEASFGGLRMGVTFASGAGALLTGAPTSNVSTAWRVRCVR